MAASCTAVRVLISDWQSPTTSSHSSRPRAPPGLGERSDDPARTDRHGLVRPTGAGLEGWRWPPDERSLRWCDVTTSPPSPDSILPPDTDIAQVFEPHVFACSRIVFRRTGLLSYLNGLLDEAPDPDPTDQAGGRHPGRLKGDRGEPGEVSVTNPSTRSSV